jgi:hypothetical protein
MGFRRAFISTKTWTEITDTERWVTLESWGIPIDLHLRVWIDWDVMRSGYRYLFEHPSFPCATAEAAAEEQWDHGAECP